MEFKLITLTPLKRRITYVTVFEIFAILFSTFVLMYVSGGDAQESLPAATLVSVIAIVWNYIYNTLFESWERRKQIIRRTVVIRTIHAIGFETGLLIFTLPLYMVWYQVGLWAAFIMVAALMLFFLIYTFLFTLVFDQIFTLPKHTKPTT